MPTATIVGYDPAVHQHEAEALGIKIVETAIDAFNGADVCIFQTNHPAFERLPLDTLSNLMTANGLIYDYWNQFSADQYKLSKDTKYAGLGNWINVEKPAKAYS
jgi:UDP-N-acetyl-D-mannosaminuronate dehydrogenase